jgi:hypothetical protein
MQIINERNSKAGRGRRGFEASGPLRRAKMRPVIDFTSRSRERWVGSHRQHTTRRRRQVRRRIPIENLPLAPSERAIVDAHPRTNRAGRMTWMR